MFLLYNVLYLSSIDGFQGIPPSIKSELWLISVSAERVDFVHPAAKSCRLRHFVRNYEQTLRTNNSNTSGHTLQRQTPRTHSKSASLSIFCTMGTSKKPPLGSAEKQNSRRTVYYSMLTISCTAPKKNQKTQKLGLGEFLNDQCMRAWPRETVFRQLTGNSTGIMGR